MGLAEYIGNRVSGFLLLGAALSSLSLQGAGTVPKIEMPEDCRFGISATTCMVDKNAADARLLIQSRMDRKIAPLARQMDQSELGKKVLTMDPSDFVAGLLKNQNTGVSGRVSRELMSMMRLFEQNPDELSFLSGNRGLAGRSSLLTPSSDPASIFAQEAEGFASDSVPALPVEPESDAQLTPVDMPPEEIKIFHAYSTDNIFQIVSERAKKYELLFVAP